MGGQNETLLLLGMWALPAGVCPQPITVYEVKEVSLCNTTQLTVSVVPYNSNLEPLLFELLQKSIMEQLVKLGLRQGNSSQFHPDFTHFGSVFQRC